MMECNQCTNYKLIQFDGFMTMGCFLLKKDVSEISLCEKFEESDESIKEREKEENFSKGLRERTDSLSSSLDALILELKKG